MKLKQYDPAVSLYENAENILERYIEKQNKPEYRYYQAIVRIEKAVALKLDGNKIEATSVAEAVIPVLKKEKERTGQSQIEDAGPHATRYVYSGNQRPGLSRTHTLPRKGPRLKRVFPYIIPASRNRRFWEALFSESIQVVKA